VSTWKDLHNEGVRLAANGDLPGARTALEGALAVSSTADRAQCLLNLAHVVDLAGDRQHAVDLMTEAIPVADEPVRTLVVASRADLLPWLGRWDEAWQDVEAALVDAAEPSQQVALRNTRIALLMMAGRLAEAEEDATASVELAARHAPEFLPNLYTNLAILADEAGDEQRAATCRLLAENPGQQPLDPRWHRFVELNAEGSVLASSGDRAGASAKFQAAYGETAGVDGVEAMVCRATVAGNLAGVAEDLDEALRWSTEAATVARSELPVVGDAYGTATVLVNALVSRAWQLNLLARMPEALADLAEAAEAVHGSQELEAAVRSTRARVLATGGWYAEAAEEARLALELAYAAVPPLAATVHMTLAEITSGTGDLPGAVEHLALARDLAAATGDVDGQATATLSWARLAYLAADGDRADALYDEAERLLTGDPRRLMACLVGRAAVAVLRGRPRDAVELVDRARALLGSAATPLELVAVNQVRGSAFETLGEFAAADSCYGEASALCEAAGLWHVALGMAWWRADALVRRAAAVAGDERREIAVRALDLALPAALAAEAVRHRFPHGPLRERWVALAAAPATRAAFWAIGAMEDPALAAEYIDHIAGAVSLHAEGVMPVERGELVSLPEPPAAEPRLPYAASGFTVGEAPAFPAEGFELPPRVRVDPAVPSTLDAWIDVAEERYGFPVRAAEAVASW
jgi:tetratricopeptide (TPR) repeat protein